MSDASEEHAVPMSDASEEHAVPMSDASEEHAVPMSDASEEHAVPVSAADLAAAPRFSNPVAAAVVVGSLALAGGVLGALWALLAPSVRGAVADTRDNGRVHIYVGDQADNFFVSTTILVAMTTVLAVVAAVAVWQWKAHRGPIMLWGLTIGSLAAAGTAAGVGAGLARLRYGALDIANMQFAPGQRINYVVEAPAVFYGHSLAQITVTLILAPLMAAVTYAFCVVACVPDDLEAWPPARRTVELPPLPPTVESV